jgi:hypothetical protein
MRQSSWYSQPEPSRQGVHCPQLSCLKKRAMLRATATMSVSSSNTVGHAVPEAQDVVLAPDVEVHLGLVLVGAQDAHGDAAGDGALVLLAAAHAAAVVSTRVRSGMPSSHS